MKWKNEKVLVKNAFQTFPWRLVEKIFNLYFTIWEFELIDIIDTDLHRDFFKTDITCQKYCLRESTVLLQISILMKHSTKNY